MVAERDTEVRALTAAVARWQHGRDEDTRRRLIRSGEQREALAGVKGREAVLAGEKRKLVQEAQRLRGRQLEAVLQEGSGAPAMPRRSLDAPPKGPGER